MKKIKITVFIFSFIFLVFLINLVDQSKFTHFYNIDNSYNDTLNIQIRFKDNTLNKKELYLYYSDSVNTNSAFSESKKVNTIIENGIAEFNFFTHKIPKLIRINFDKSIKKTIEIDQILFKINNKKVNIDLTTFLSHPSIKITKKTHDLLTINLSPDNKTKYDPFIYSEKPLYFHKISKVSYFLILLVLLILSFLISEFFSFLINFKGTKNNFNTILLFLLLVSLLFKEHWISKVTILITGYTIFLIFREKPKFKEIHFFGFLFFFLFAAFSMFWSVNIERSLPKLIGFIPFIIIPVWGYFLSSEIRYDKIFKNVGIVFVLTSFVTFLLAFFRFNTTHQMEEFYYHTLASPLSTNAIYISILYLMVFLFNLYIILNRKEKIQIIELFILTVLFLYILFLSSKLIIVLLFLTSIIISYPLLKLRSESKKNLRIGLILLSTIFLMIILFNKNISMRFEKIFNIEKVKEVYSKSEFDDNYLWNGLTLRLFQLRAFYDIEKNESFNSFLGVGLNNGQTLLNEKYKSYKLYTGKKWEANGGYLGYNFHNQYVQTLIEIGFIGFLLLIFIYYSFFKTAKNNKNRLLFSVLFIFIFVMFTESVLVRQKGIMFFVLFPIIAIKTGQLLKQKRLF